MKLIYLMNDGGSRIENAKINARMIEMPDGYHPLTNDSVWQDSKRRKNPVLFIIQGVLRPYGATMAKEDIFSILYDIELAEQGFRTQSVSKMWQRQIAAILSWMGKSLPYLFIVAIAGYGIYTTLVGGN